MIWFTSDTHAFHKNICRGSTAWEDANGQNLRPFKDQYEMTEKLIENINKHVKQDDTLWHLGDWSFGGTNSIWNFRKRLNCKNIHLVYGNHDQHIEKNIVLPNVISTMPYGDIFIDGDSNKYGGLKPGDGEYPNYVGAQRLFLSVQHYKELSINKTRFVLSHFAHRVWNKSHHGSIHLYGHSHGTLKDNTKEGVYDKGKSMDVGVDTHAEFRPYSIEEIMKIMEKRENIRVDHHNKDTN